jgi:hypothetical protein
LWYPRRLIDLAELKSKEFLDTKRLISTGYVERDKLDAVEVKVVEKRDWEDARPGHENVRYVTLSHRWGLSSEPQLKLTTKNIQTLKKGIRLDTLPKTFRDAIQFASRLPRVGFIWIDSLCIKQGEDEKLDWLAESAVMDEVYSNAFLNISATAAKSNAEGLFRARRPELLLEDEITLNVDGIPGALSSGVETNPGRDQSSQAAITTSQPVSLLHQLRIVWLVGLWSFFFRIFRIAFGPSNNVELSHKSLPQEREKSTPATSFTKSGDSNSCTDVAAEKIYDSSTDTDPHNLHRCTILDVSFWKTHVDEAPVNRRGWVLQERLMAPRVLHFCYDQIAWECSEFDAAEGRPRGVPNFQLNMDGMVQERRLKGINPKTNGKELRRLRLNGVDEPDPHLIPEIYAFEIWRRIVEVYSKTAITVPNDKLIALSRMAKWMSRQLGTGHSSDTYIAGLWRKHLESQLLWRVEPVFREVDGSFETLSTRPPRYRAPSFSWASIDSEKENGIVYGEVTDQDIFIRIQHVQIDLESQESKYGLVIGGHIILWGKLRRAKLFKKDKGRFSWRLVGREELDSEEHTNVYLDCPDEDDVFETDDVYCLPAAMGERDQTKESKYLICLLLQLVHGEKATFRRIGLTKLSPWADKLARHQLLDSFESDVDIPHDDYDAETGTHGFYLI